ARLLRKWIILPLISKDAIENRLAMVQYFMEKEHDFDSPIRVIGDLERLIAKVPLAKINPREVQQLRRALQAIEPIKLQLANSNQISLQKFAEGLNSCQVLQSEITKMIVDDAPTNTLKGNFIADGANVELDELRHIIKNSQQLLLELQQREINKTGISNLKIGFNSVFGYYLEVTNKFKDQTPESWIRKQTLANAERYVTEELKNLETKILSAEEKMLALEEQLYQKLLGFILDYVQPVKHNAAIIAQLDCLLCFAKIAEKNNYCKPEITEDFTLDIRSGRHPVIEQQLPLGEVFVPNDTFLDTEQIQIMLLTGPNMSGKSALLRQTALICLMAQMGSYVPANQAFIGIVDKIFTRVGASDNISSGESTFMVEMNETASILNNISERSLILLDEIGRGTSTYDGISIAWSIAEYLHDNLLAKPKTLFATHYHELNELAERHSRIHNFHIATKELNNKVIFLRKLTPGGSHHSFGIHVARMAGMPKSIVERANEILLQLEQQSIENGLPNQQAFSQKVKQVSQPLQLNIFGATNPELEKITQEILSLDLNSLTPIECMMKLQQWKHLLQT
ncbi:MAG: DNA mismatch repair protein MutS, partial [Saprospiraceae bacterium]|nr:DNA mismatch repair protein MutS [Saprospiraceae bacterium]